MWVEKKDVAGFKLTRTDAQNNPTRLLTKTEGLPTVLRLDSPLVQQALNNGALGFEFMHDIQLYYAHNEMQFYIWDVSDLINGFLT